MNSTSSPIIETARLIAVEPHLACHEEYATMLLDPEFIQCYGVAYSREQALKRLESDIAHGMHYGFAPWLWYDKETNHFIGRGGLKTFLFENTEEVELTYQIEKTYWGKGLATEIGNASLHYAEERLNLASVICFTAHNNSQSLQVMKKLGFIFECDFVHASILHKLYRFLLA